MELHQRYFNDINKTVYLQKGDHLFRKGDNNERLYLMISGKVKGYDPEDEGEYFSVSSREFIGVNSFFTSASVCRMSAVAVEDSILRYIQKSDYADNATKEKMAADFMPCMILSMVRRQEELHRADIERLRILKEIKDTERMAALGQLSAGVAHELNNAITVIARGSQQLVQSAKDALKDSPYLSYFERGSQEGRCVSGHAAREKAKELKKKASVDEGVLREYCRTGSEEDLLKLDVEQASEALAYWNMGATLHDLGVAAEHSEHVIDSMQTLARSGVVRQAGVDVKESIEKAVFLLSRPLRDAELKLNIDELPAIYGNLGELVQVWANLIKNGVEAMACIPLERRVLTIDAGKKNDGIQVTVKDTGSGIPAGVKDKIFEPQITTKKEGKTLGLGLGLTIVKRIVDRYSGAIEVDSSSSGTSFTVTLPMGGEK